jgi:hypothetical protein
VLDELGPVAQECAQGDQINFGTKRVFQ